MALSRITASLLLFLPAAAASAQSRPAATPDELIHKVESCLSPPVTIKGQPPSCTPLLTRMQQLHIPGVSIAVVHHGVIAWARGYGTANPAGAPVTPETIFEVGSISKPVAAMAALHLVQEGKLSLDADVNTKLTSWKVPPSDAAPGAVLTLRELLTHTGGTTVHGFPGYAAGSPVPTLIQVLDGVPPANTPAIRIVTPPGTRWNYSGGGYTIMQQMLLDTTHEPFPTFMQDTVLTPIGMTHSTYEQPLPPSLQAHAAAPYDIHGQPLPGGAHTYPEMAAAGLWSTPSDLARYILENQRSLEGKANHVLSAAMTKDMMTPGKGSWGLGVQIGGSPSNPYFEHGGTDAGFEAFFVGYENQGEGAVIETNAEGGSRICDQVISAIAAAYGWPDFHPVERTEIKLAPDALTRLAGTYHAQTPSVDFVVSVENGQLMILPPHGQKAQLHAESPTLFFPAETPVEIEFVPGENGQITALIVHQGQQDLRAKKIQ